VKNYYNFQDAVNRCHIYEIILYFVLSDCILIELSEPENKFQYWFLQ